MKIRNKLIFGFGGGMVVMCIILSFMSYSAINNIGVRLLGQQGISILRLIRTNIDAEKLLALADTIDNSQPYYEELRKYLFQIKKDCKLKYLYTIKVVDSKTVMYIVDGGNPDDKNFSKLGDRDDIANYEAISLKENYNKGISLISNGSYKSDWGELITAAEPILDKNGKTIAFVAADFPLSMISVEVNRVQIMIAVISILITLVFLLLISFMLYRMFSPLKYIDLYCKKMAEGDFGYKIDEGLLKKNDEIGLILNNFNEINKSISKMVNDMSNSGEKVAVSSVEMSTALSVISVGAQKQTDSLSDVKIQMDEAKKNMNSILTTIHSQTEAVERTSSAIAEISSTINVVAKNADLTMKLSEGTSENAKNGVDSVGKVLDKMKVIESEVKNIELEVDNLGRMSQEIGGIVDVINDIAAQTNLLALNAAIEAAHAGDLGKGFAVVAGEIRALAERSADSTKEIEKLIKGVQREVKKVVQSVRNGYDEARLGAKLSEEAGGILNNIIVNVEKTTQEIENLSKSIDEQSSAVEDISRAIESISEGSRIIEGNTIEQMKIVDSTAKGIIKVSEISQETFSLTEEVASSGIELAGVSQNLKVIISKIKAGK